MGKQAIGRGPRSGWAVLALCLLPCAAATAQEPGPAADVIDDIDELWSGFDPYVPELDIEIIETRQEDGLTLESLYFTSEHFDGEPVRVFAYRGRPRDGRRVAGILHIHGGGQTASLEWVRFWAERGYASVSFDFCGDTNDPQFGPGYRREHHTHWGRVPADMLRVSGGLSMSPTPRSNPWYHWALAARRALTLLEQTPGVDGRRLGIFGVSVGGTLCWTVAGVDDRVRAAAPIYGCGWEFYPYPPDVSAPVDDELRLWRRLIAPEAHAERIRCPVFLLSATNDFHGRMDLAYRTLDRIPSAPRWQVFTPNYDHHVEPSEGVSLPHFFAAYLGESTQAWPVTPCVQVRVGEPDSPSAGRPVVHVEPDQPADVQAVEVYYALNNDWPTTRFWRRATLLTTETGGWSFAAECLARDDVLTVYANVRYAAGYTLGSRLLRQPLAELIGIMPTLVRTRCIDSLATDAAWNWVPADTDPLRQAGRFFEPWTGPRGEQGFTLAHERFPHEHATGYYFGTRKIGDPQACSVGESHVLLDFFAAHRPQRLTLYVFHRPPGSTGLQYSADATELLAAAPASADDPDWQTLVLARELFQHATVGELPDWDHVQFFVLDGQNAAGQPPVFRHLRWGEVEPCRQDAD